MAKGSLFSIASLAVNQMIVIDKNGDIKIATIGEKLPEGAVIIQRGDEAGFNNEATTQLVDQNNELQDVTDDVAQLLAALEEGQDPTQLDEELAPAAGGSNGSAPTDSASIDRVGSEIIASTNFSTTGFESLGFSQTQSLALINLNRSNSNVITEAADRNSDPKAQNDTISVDEDTSVTIDVLSNDSDKDGDTLTIVSATVPQEQGSVEIVGGKLVFTPAENYNGQANIEYTISDGQGGSDTAKVTVTVNPVNDVPVAKDNEVITEENTVLNSNVPEAHDVDGTIESYQLVNSVTSGTLTFNKDGSYKFDPGSEFDYLDEDETTEVTFTYTATDNEGAISEVKTITIVVTGTNDSPIIDVDNEGYADTGSITEDGVLVDGVVSTTTLSGSVSASDKDDTSLSWTSTGTVSVSDEDAATLAANNVSASELGTFTLDANGNWTFELNTDNTQFLDDGESLTLTYPVSVSDGDASDTESVTITITGTNDAPIIDVDNEGYADTDSITEDGVLVAGVVSTTTLSGSVSASDKDDTSLSWTSTGTASVSDEDAATLAANNVSASELGTFTLDANGNWTFELNTDNTQFLDDGESLTLTYPVSVSDGDASDTESVTITITGTNDAPIIDVDNEGYADTGSITEDGVLVDGVVSTTTLSGSVSASDKDDTSLSWTSTGTVSVSDEDAATLAANNVSASELGTFTLDANGNWTFELNTDNTQFLDDGESLTLTYPVSVSDGDASDTESVTITITGTNDAPIIDVDNEGYADTDSITEDGVLVAGVVSTTTLSGSVSASDKDDTSLSWTSTGTASVSDEDAATLAANNVSASELGTFTLDANGNWTFELNTDNTQFLDDGESLTLMYPVSVSDGDASDTESVTITITGTNDAPIIDVDNEGYADTGSITEDGVLVDGVVSTTTLSGSVSASDKDDTSLSWTSTGTVSVSDEDAATLAANNVSASELGTFTLDANGNWTFELNTDNTQFLDDGESLTLTYPVSVSDGDASDTESVTITITGTNDAPIIDVDNEGYADTDSITEDGVLVDGVVSTTTLSGSVSASDKDDTSLSWTSTGTVSVSDEDAATLAANNVSASELGTFTLDANGNWTFELNTDNTQFLDDGESLTLTYPVSVSDGDASDTESVTITITGTNDAPIIDVDNEGYADTDSITEDGVLVDGVVSTTTLSGSVSASDKDDTSLSWTSTGTVSVSDEDAATLAANNVSASELGTFTLDANGNWTFELNTGNTQFLDDGESLTLTYAVSVSDGDASDTESVTITITGTNDAPIAVADSETVNEGSTVIVSESVLINDTDAEKDSLTVVGIAKDSSGNGEVTADPDDGSFTLVTELGGTVVMKADGAYTYTAPDYLIHSNSNTIQDSFTYLASDGVDNSVWTTVTIDVLDTGITAQDDYGEVSNETNLATGNVVTNDLQDDTDPDVVVTSVTYNDITYDMPESDVLTIEADTGTLVIKSDGYYTFTPSEGSRSQIVVDDVTNSSEVSVYASTDRSIEQSEAKVAKHGNSGVGVAGGQGNQLDGSESLVIALNQAASSVSATLKNNGNGNDDEIEVSVYDIDGNNISEEVSISIVNHVVTVTSDSGYIGYVVFGLSSDADSNDKYRIDETISVTYIENSSSSSEEVFTYTVEDGDGDESSAQLTIGGIDSVNDAPVITLSEGADSVAVSEEGLAGANSDANGDTDITNEVQATGSFVVSDEESGDSDLTVALVAPTETLYSNGTEIEWAIVDGKLVGTAGSEEVINVSLTKDSSNSYSYTVTLLAALDHEVSDVEDTLTFDFNVSVSDGVNTTTETISVTVEDDSPESSASVIINAVATDISESHTVLGTYSFTRSSTTGCNTENAYKFISNNSDKSITVTAVGLNGTTHEELTFSEGGIGVSSYKQGGWNTGFDDRFNSEVDYKYVNGEWSSEQIVIDLGDNIAYGLTVDFSYIYSGEGEDSESGIAYFYRDGVLVSTQTFSSDETSGDYAGNFYVANGGFDKVVFEATSNGNGETQWDNSDFAIKSVTFIGLSSDPVIASASGEIEANYGADDAGSIELTGITDSDLKTVSGQAVTVTVSENHTSITGIDEDGKTVFEIKLTPATGQWEYYQYIELADGETVQFTYNVIDADGDTASSTIEHEPEITLVSSVDFSQDDDVSEGTVVATYTASDADNDVVTVNLSDTTYYQLDGSGNVVLTEAGAELVENGEDLPEFTLTPTDGVLSGDSVAVDPSVTQVITSGLNGEFYNVDYQLGTIAQALDVIKQEANATFVATEVSYRSQNNDDLGDYNKWNGSTNLEAWLGDDTSSVEFESKVDSNDSVVRLSGGVELGEGSYSIKVNADDGYQITIDGVVVASYDDNTSVKSNEFSFTVAESGVHEIEVVYWDQGGAYVLEVSLNDGSESGYQTLGSDAYKTYTTYQEFSEGSIVVDSDRFEGFIGDIDSAIAAYEHTTSDSNFGTWFNDHIEGNNFSEILSGEPGDDWLEGGKGNDYLYGQSGNDLLDGGKGNDTLYGGSGNDILVGGNDDGWWYGGDELYGGDGNDVLIGGTGHNTLTGGEGSDLFVLSDNSSNTITDFNAGDDALDVSELLKDDVNDDIGQYLNDAIHITNDGHNNLEVTVDGHSSLSVSLDGLNSNSVDTISVLFDSQIYKVNVDS